MRDRGVDEALGALGPQAEHADVATRIGDLARLHRAGWKDGRLNLDGAVGEGLAALADHLPKLSAHPSRLGQLERLGRELQLILGI